MKEQITELLKTKSKKEVAEILFISELQLKFLLKQWGFIRSNHSMPRPERNELVQKYAELKSIPNVAEYYKISHGVIFRWFKELKIPTRRMNIKGKELQEFLENHLSLLDVK